MTFTRSMFLGGAILLVVGIMFIASPEPSFAADAAQTISTGLGTAAINAGYSDKLTLTVFIGSMIKTLLAATGIIFLIITVYAGILYMTAAGETEKIKKAKGMLTSSVIGIVIIVGAYAITYYVVEALVDATDTTTT